MTRLWTRPLADGTAPWAAAGGAVVDVRSHASTRPARSEVAFMPHDPLGLNASALAPM